MNRAIHAVQRWSTDDVDEPQRLAFYAHAISSAIDSMQVLRRVEGRFQAGIESVELGPVSLIRGRGQAHDVIRDHRDLARSTARNYHLILNKGSAWRARHVGEHLVRAGDAMLVDSIYGYRFDFLDTIDIVHLKLPDAWLRQWVPDPAVLVGQPIRADADWGQALTAFVRQLSMDLVGASPVPASQLTDHVGGLLALHANALGMRAPAITASSRSLIAGIREILAQRCTEPALTAAQVADCLAVSLRTLHRALAAHQLAFGTELMRSRVELATRMLESPLFRRLTTAEIGRRAGFSDPSHFARVYRRLCGVTPAKVHAAAGG